MADGDRTARRAVEFAWEDVRRLAAERFGVARFRPGQRELIAAALEGRDAIGILPTGAGKSLTYQLPSLLLPGTTVVVSPLIALMQDQHDKMADADVGVARLDSSLTACEQRAAEREVGRGRADLVYLTPERLEKEEHLGPLRRAGVSLLVVDEAHCVSQWGHDFRPAYLGLRQVVRELGRPPVLALTATSPPQVTADIARQLALDAPEVVNGGIERDNLFFEVRPSVNRAAKERHLLALLRERGGPAIVYAATVRRVDELHRWLRGQGVDATRYHGQLRMREREEAQDRFMAGERPLVVATNAFGMGIDKPDVRLVAHWNFPASLESYYQEAGRAGRDGAPAAATLLYRLEDRRVQAFFQGGRYPHRADLARLHAALARAGEAGATAADLGRAADVPARRAAVASSLLEGMGVAARRGRRFVVARPFAGDEELEAYLSAYDRRHAEDRERLAAMMRYAQSALCRVQFLRDYFAEPAGAPCGHCDNCASGAALRPPTPPAPPARRARPAAPRPARPPRPAAAPALAPGEHVRHARLGEGEVVRAEGEKITVAFVRGGERKVRAGFLRRAAPPADAAPGSPP